MRMIMRVKSILWWAFFSEIGGYARHCRVFKKKCLKNLTSKMKTPKNRPGWSQHWRSALPNWMGEFWSWSWPLLNKIKQFWTWTRQQELLPKTQVTPQQSSYYHQYQNTQVTQLAPPHKRRTSSSSQVVTDPPAPESPWPITLRFTQDQVAAHRRLCLDTELPTTHSWHLIPHRWLLHVVVTLVATLPRVLFLTQSTSPGNQAGWETWGGLEWIRHLWHSAILGCSSLAESMVMEHIPPMPYTTQVSSYLQEQCNGKRVPLFLCKWKSPLLFR